jgi:hypothetical protein
MYSKRGLNRILHRWAKPKPPDKRSRPSREKNEEEGDKSVPIPSPGVLAKPNQGSNEKEDKGNRGGQNEYGRAIYTKTGYSERGGAKKKLEHKYASLSLDALHLGQIGFW